jgi:hypothetical protein
LAGHANIDISSHYYANISNLVECLTLERFRKTNKTKSTGAMLGGSSKYSLSIPSVTRKVGGGLCTSEVYNTGSVEDCLKISGRDGHIGDCRRCVWYLPDNPGVMLEFNNDKAAREQLGADSRYLIRMIELVRKGLGNEEDISAALLRIQHSGNHYSKCLWEKYTKERGHQWQGQEK